MPKNTIIHILEKAHFTDHFIKYLKENFSDTMKIKPSPYAKNPEDNPLLQLNPHERMIETLTQLLHLKAAYEAKGIPLKHFYKSIYDLSYRIERYKKQHGSYGLSERDIRWLTPIFQMEIFDIGVLRFQISHFSYEEIERSGHQYMHLSNEWKEKIPAGTPIITLHIMKDASITPDKVTASFQEAVPFFNHYFPNHHYNLFVCRTWLIYEPIQDLLGEKSNITSFAKRFTIIAQNKNPKQALERIYGTSDMEEIKQMAMNSSLQKLAYKNIDKIGEAAGIIDKREIT